MSERKYIKKINTGLRKIRDKKSINNDILNEVFDCLGYNPSKITTNKLQEELDQNSVKKHIYKNIPIKITNILGAIGLTTDYAFLVNFDDQYLLDNKNVTDKSICQFLVALTRAKTKTYIFTSKNDYPTYLQWIENQFFEEH